MKVNYLWFNLTFLFCCGCICGTFLFCLRAFYLHKVEKLDPVNVVRTQKGVKQTTAGKRIEREKELERMLENG